MMITVLGATGFIGGHLARLLRAQGREVFTPGREEITQGALPDFLGDVFYCIGSDDWTSPKAVVDANFSLLKTVVDQARFRNLVYLSSSRVYLGADSTDEDAALVIQAEDSGAIYNTAKILAERYCLAQDNPAIKVVRLSNVVGFAPTAQFFLPTLIRNALTIGKISFTIGRDSSKDYVLIDDVLHFFLRLTGPTRQRLYNFASGVNTTAAAIADQLQQHTGCEVSWLGGPDICFPSIALGRVAEEFGSPPPFDPLDVLADLVDRQRRWLAECGRA